MDFIKKYSTGLLSILCFTIIILCVIKYNKNDDNMFSENIENWDKIFYKKQLPIYNIHNAVRVIVFNDYECPYCQQFEGVLKNAKDEFKSTIDISYYHYPLPDHKSGYYAAIASECANRQNSFERYHSELFKRTFSLSTVDFVKLAELINIDDINKFSSCYSSEEVAELVKKDINLADSLGIFEVPAYLINGTLYKGATSQEVFTKLIKERLK